MLELTHSLVEDLPKNGPSDPIEYYRRPLVGRLYRARINMGLRLLPRDRYRTGLEVGYGAGAVLLAMATGVQRLHGLDLEADPEPITKTLAKRGHTAILRRGDVCRLPYPDRMFDLVVSFSVFEHLTDYRGALREVARVMTEDAVFLLGMPATTFMMDVGFRLIGCNDIGERHVTSPARVARAFDECGLTAKRSRRLGLPVGPLTLYYTWLLERDHLR